MKQWALWIINMVGFDGFRFDAVKHFSEDFMIELVDFLAENTDKDLFFVGTIISFTNPLLICDCR
jgi:alpha-amylase